MRRGSEARAVPDGAVLYHNGSVHPPGAKTRAKKRLRKVLPEKLPFLTLMLPIVRLPPIIRSLTDRREL